MRVTMYTGDYVPMAVLELSDAEIQRVRRNVGHEIQIAATEPMNYNSLGSATANLGRYRTFRIMLLVEGMEWGDGVTRPILVARGLTSGSIPEGQRLDSMAYNILHGCLAADPAWAAGETVQLRDFQRAAEILNNAPVPGPIFDQEYLGTERLWQRLESARETADRVVGVPAGQQAQIMQEQAAPTTPPVDHAAYAGGHAVSGGAGPVLRPRPLAEWPVPVRPQYRRR